MPKKTMKSDFDEISDAYPECTNFVTTDVMLDVLSQPASQVSATIEAYGQTPNGQPRYLLTVWNSQNKPAPASITLKLGRAQIVRSRSKQKQVKSGKP